MVAFRDAHGVRPLVIGKLEGGYCVASETCALDQIGANLVREVRPGEAVRLTAAGVESRQALTPSVSRMCVFEHIYFARPDSLLDGRNVWEQRRAMGIELANEAPVEADMVVGLPDSGTPAAIGYAFASGIPYSEAVVRNRYVGRSFIQPDQELRKSGVKLKFNPLREIIDGKRLIVVDDSIVRGTTTGQVVAMLREAGALRGPHAHLEPADRLAMLLRDRHALPPGTHRLRTIRSTRWRARPARPRSRTCRWTASSARSGPRPTASAGPASLVSTPSPSPTRPPSCASKPPGPNRRERRGRDRPGHLVPRRRRRPRGGPHPHGQHRRLRPRRGHRLRRRTGAAADARGPAVGVHGRGRYQTAARARGRACSRGSVRTSWRCASTT